MVAQSGVNGRCADREQISNSHFFQEDTANGLLDF
ncbi:hypothetical protein SAMN04490187_5304 [Pseudomonas jessenii]|uniref:Uncharacterized protein n=1 Tax=Pseudomonas jessenii TaxID=77298 RepID=A0A1H4UJ30_PSEJE|nr:hypothetical protein SAMN04490187_5304 [Pseudomonas jessenii]